MGLGLRVGLVGVGFRRLGFLLVVFLLFLSGRTGFVLLLVVGVVVVCVRVCFVVFVVRVFVGVGLGSWGL